MAAGRIVWVDIAKGVAMLAVVLGHTYHGGILAHTVAYSFNVPLFFILAGFTFRVKPMRDALASSAKRLLLPYLALALIAGIYDIIQGWLNADTVLQFLGGIVFAAGEGGLLPGGIFPIGMPWFLMALFVGRLLYNALLGFFEKKRVHSAIVFIIFAAIGCAAKFGSAYIALPFALMQALTALLYLHIGHCMRTYDWTGRAPVPVTIGCLVVWAIGVRFELFFWEGVPWAVLGGIATVVAASWCVIQACRLVDLRMPPLRRALSFVGVNSLLVFELHVVESFIIPWADVSFAALGPLSPVLLGVLHLAFVCAILWLVKNAGVRHAA